MKQTVDEIKAASSESSEAADAVAALLGAAIVVWRVLLALAAGAVSKALADAYDSRQRSRGATSRPPRLAGASIDPRR